METKRNIITPQRLTIPIMENVLKENNCFVNNRLFTSDDFAISRGANFIRSFVNLSQNVPYLIEDYRVGWVVKGEINVKVNLIEQHITENSILFISKGSIVQLHSVSPDLEVKGFIASQNLITKIFHSNAPSIIDETPKNFIVEGTAQDMQFIDNITKTMWELVHSGQYPNESLYGLVQSALYYIDGLSKQVSTQNAPTTGNIRNRELFRRFISLVNQNCTKEHTLSFYADKLCISPRYLSSIINEQSGNSAKYWIDEAIVTRAKIMLHHTEKSISQIASDLNFPNDSFFCKFFRRLTNCSPNKYRNV